MSITRSDSISRFLITLTLASGATSAALAQPVPAAAFDSQQVFVWTVGAIDATRAWEFTVNEDIRVTAIGVYDREPAPGPGLAAAHDVIVWDVDGNVVVPMATVPAGTGGTLFQSFRYVDVSPTRLRAGRTYMVAAFWPQTPFDHYPDVNSSGTPIEYHPAIAFVQSRTALFQPGLAFPTIISNNNFAVGVVNFLLEPAGCEPCDLNCDGAVDAFDVEPFIEVLVGFPPPLCSPCAGDANGDGVVDAFDIEPFVECLAP